MKRRDITIKTDSIIENQYYINELQKLNYRKHLKFMILTYGCQMNEHDTEKLKGMLSMMGYNETDDEKEADLILFNTCSVRENAEFKVYGNLGRVKHLKEKKPELVVGVCGCMMQQPHIVEAIKTKYRFVNLVFGTHNVHNFPYYLYEALFNDKKVFEVWEDSNLIIEELPVSRKVGIKAYVNIMYGCNNFCSYCIVPYTRGREKSRLKEDIINEIKELVSTGVREVTLLGQNVNSYGLTSKEPYDFSDLLMDVAKIEGLERVRFMTSHPKDLSDKLIDTIASSKKICNHVHLPVQSGSNDILRKMNRKYTREYYLDLVSKIKNRIPDVALTTDIIIGFPGEREEDVLETIDLIRQTEYDSAFTFIYSKRVGTPAEKYDDDVSDKEKHERFQRMLSELNEIVINKNKSLEGQVYGVLVESRSKSESKFLSGRTEHNRLVIFEGPDELIGKIVDVKIIRARNFSLEGEIL